MSEEHKNSWNAARSKTQAETKSTSEIRRNYLSTALTILLAAAIIVAGFVTPSMLYSVIDTDRGTLTRLADPDSEDVSLHVFDEPVSLYPWNLYSFENTSDLSYSDRNFLYEHNVPQMLITAMTVYGMDVNLLQSPTEQTSAEYVAELIVDAFSFLLTDAENYQGCYVIYALDINSDGTPDLRCAVDQSGVIISMIFLSPPWVPSADAVGQNPEATGEGGAAPTDATPPAGGVAAPDNASPEGETTTPPDGTTMASEEYPHYALVLDGLERAPVGEELALWSFTHLIALSAAENGQVLLGEAATTLDTGFTERYANSESASKSQGYSPTPTVFATEEYALYIYDLPTGVRFILYYDTEESRCVGFNLQL